MSNQDSNYKEAGWENTTPFQMVLENTKNALFIDDLCAKRCQCGLGCVIPPHAGAFKRGVEERSIHDVINCITQQLMSFLSESNHFFENVDKFRTYFGIPTSANTIELLMEDLHTRGIDGWSKHNKDFPVLYIPFYVNYRGTGNGSKAKLSVVLELHSIVHPAFIATNIVGGHWVRDGKHRVVLEGRFFVLTAGQRLVRSFFVSELMYV